MATDTDRCDNLACLCTVPTGTTVCSDYCGSVDGRDPQVVTCSCGHEVCAKAIDAQLHGGAGSEG